MIVPKGVVLLKIWHWEKSLEDTIEHRALIGVIHLPVLDLTYAAARGLGSRCNGSPVRVSRESEIEKSIITVGDPAQFIRARREDAYRRIQELSPYLRGYTDCFGHTLVIKGSVAAMIDPDLNPWDVLATQVLVEEAGGTMILRPSRLALMEHLSRSQIGRPSPPSEVC